MKYRLLLAILMMTGTAAAQVGEPAAENDAVFPQQLSARDLLYRCNASNLTGAGRERRSYCAGFISGVEEAVRLQQTAHGSSGLQVCMPTGITSRQLADVYSRFAGQNPAFTGKPAAEAVLGALQNAFPCPRTTDK